MSMLFRPVIKTIKVQPELSEDDMEALALGRALLSKTQGTVLHALLQKQEMPAIHLHAGDVTHTVERGAVQVTHQPSDVVIQKGAIHAPVTVEPAQVNLPPTNVQVHHHEAPVEGDAKITYDPMGRPTGIRRV